jgi:hypothetical protein
MFHNYPFWVRSGEASLALYFDGNYPWGAELHKIQQPIHGAVPGTTYRFSVWGKMWSSTGDDHAVSIDPAPMNMWICISTYGSRDDPGDTESAVCTNQVRPYDTWHYFSVDAVAKEEYIVVWLLALHPGGTKGIAIWDDASLTVAPAAATTTPMPTSQPSRPAPVPFDANAFYDAMLKAQSDMQQMGGLLDRVALDGPQSCGDFRSWYEGLVLAPPYDGVPAEWSSIYGDYVWAVEHALATNDHLYGICGEGGGMITKLEYGEARIGIHESLERIGPAIETAAGKLGR